MKLNKNYVGMLIVLALLVTGCYLTINSGPDWTQVRKDIKPSVVMVLVAELSSLTGLPEIKNFGSGFVISEDGYIATCAHVVDGIDNLKNPWILVMFSDKSSYLAKEVQIDDDNDIALVRIDISGLKPLKFERVPLASGQPVLTMGSTDISNWSISTGIIGQTEIMHKADINHGFILTTAAVNPGCSGGPVVSERGRVVGMSISFIQNFNDMYLATPFYIVEEVAKSLIAGKTGREVLFP